MSVSIQGFISSFRLLDILDILLVAFVLYKLFILIRNTRAVALIKGLLVLGAVTVVSRVLDLHVINWMLQQGMTVILVALPVVFQPELRRALEQIGRGRFLQSGHVLNAKELERLIDEIVAITDSMSKTRTGALIVFEREVGLNDYIDTGVPIDGVVSRELLGNIFIPNTPLHDGAVIIRDACSRSRRTVPCLRSWGRGIARLSASARWPTPSSSSSVKKRALFHIRTAVIFTVTWTATPCATC